MPDSLSQTSRRGTAPKDDSNDHIPRQRSSVVREGIMRAQMKRECDAVITSTGGEAN